MGILVSSLVMGLIGVVVGILIRLFYEKRAHSSHSREIQTLLKDISERERNLKTEQQRIEQDIKREQERRDTEKQHLEDSKETLRRQQDHLFSVEKSLDDKTVRLDQRERHLDKLDDELLKKKEQLEEARGEISLQLEKIAKLTKEEATSQLMKELEHSLSKDMSNFILKKEEDARETSDQVAREIILNNISRLATETTAESVISSVSLPNDEMKGRIIGREGRNIRSLETKTGVDIIIDDTPEAIVVSSFDPVRREMARLTIERLIADGRIQPARIEEIHEKVKEEIKEIMRQEGENACYSLGIHNINPEMKKYIGRMKYRTSYGQNLLTHSIEVAQLASMIAGDLGLNRDLAKRGGLLHDIGKIIMDDDRGHVMAGADLARQLGESDEIINCIMAHHEEVPHSTQESLIVRIADAISAARPGARRDSFERYLERLENLENIALGFQEIEKAYAIQAGRELRVIVNSSQTSDSEAKLLARKVAEQIEANLRYPGQIRVTVFRETRFVEYAK